MTRIAHITSSLNSKYLSDFLTKLGEGLDSKEFESKVYTLPKKSMFAIGGILKSDNIDIVHTHDLDVLKSATLAAAITGKPALHTRHFPTDKKVFSGIWNINKHIVCVSEYIQKDLLMLNNVRADKLKTLLNGYDGKELMALNTDATKKQLRKTLGLKENSFVLGNISPLVRESDQGTLLKMFKKLIEKKMKTELVILGEGPLKADLERFIKDEHLEEHVHILDNKIDPKEVLVVSDVFVLTAFTDGYASLIPAAMSAQLPVVATKLGSHGEFVTEGESGYLVPCGFPERSESAIMRLYANRTLAEKLSKQAFEAATKHFQFEHTVNQYGQIYKELIQHKNS